MLRQIAQTQSCKDRLAFLNVAETSTTKPTSPYDVPFQYGSSWSHLANTLKSIDFNRLRQKGLNINDPIWHYLSTIVNENIEFFALNLNTFTPRELLRECIPATTSSKEEFVDMVHRRVRGDEPMVLLAFCFLFDETGEGSVYDTVMKLGSTKPTSEPSLKLTVSPEPEKSDEIRELLYPLFLPVEITSESDNESMNLSEESNEESAYETDKTGEENAREEEEEEEKQAESEVVPPEVILDEDEPYFQDTVEDLMKDLQMLAVAEKKTVKVPPIASKAPTPVNRQRQPFNGQSTHPMTLDGSTEHNGQSPKPAQAQPVKPKKKTKKKKKAKAVEEDKQSQELLQKGRSPNPLSLPEVDDQIVQTMSEAPSELEEGTSSSTTSEYEPTLEEDEYSQFVYDEFDNDAEFIALVEELSGLFPTFAKTDLKFRVKLADDIEKLLDELFIEMESQELKAQYENESSVEPQYDDGVYEIHDIFPNISLDIIAQKLQEYNDDKELTVIHLISPGEHEFQPVKQATQKASNEWFTMDANVHKIQEFIGENTVDEADIIHHVRLGNGQHHDALIGVIMNCRPMINKKVYPRGGRVQRGGGEKRNRPRAVITRVKSTYKYNPQSDEAKEFWTLYDSNPQFHNIDRQILINALEFFQGEVYKAVALATELISYPQYNRKPKITSSARHQRQSNDPYFAVSQKFSNYQRVKAETTTKEKDQFRKYLKSNVIDLHMLRLTQAMTLTKMVLNHWWEEEMRYREQDGNLGRFGHLAGTGAVTLITGRGIHSVGGISVIRQFVKQYLTKNGYVFEEHSGKFEVKGKRGTHR